MVEREWERASEQDRETQRERDATEVKYFFIPLCCGGHIYLILWESVTVNGRKLDCMSDKSNCCPAIEVEWRVNELQLLAFLAVVSVRLSVKRKKASLGRHYLHSTSRILSLAPALSISIGHKRTRGIWIQTLRLLLWMCFPTMKKTVRISAAFLILCWLSFIFKAVDQTFTDIFSCSV